MVIDDVKADVAADEPPGMWRRAPGWLFHGLLVVPALAWLWSHSLPGLGFWVWLFSLTALGLGAIVWTARLVTHLVARHGGEPTPDGRVFLIAPACGALLLVGVLASLPLEARWALSRSAFDDAVEDVLAGGDADHSDIEDRRIGLYNVTDVRRQDGAVFFYETNGAFIDYAGFAHLPDGPDPDLTYGLEDPQFRHLGGPWYAWTAGW